MKKIFTSSPQNFKLFARKKSQLLRTLLNQIFLLHDIDIVDEMMTGELARSKIGKHFNTIRPLD